MKTQPPACKYLSYNINIETFKRRQTKNLLQILSINPNIALFFLNIIKLHNFLRNQYQSSYFCRNPICYIEVNKGPIFAIYRKSEKTLVTSFRGQAGSDS